MNRRIRRALIALTLLIFGCTGTDFLAHNLYPERDTAAYIDYLLSPAPAFANAPYWTDDFRRELRTEPLTCIYGTHEVRRSTYFNYDNCHRRVVGQPEHYERTLWLFGNSTLQQPELPDAYTIASQLQAFVPTWRVESVTTSGQGAWAALEMAQQEDIRPGDIVVFYTGANDAAGVYVDILRHHALDVVELPCAMLNRTAVYSFHLLCKWQTLYIPDAELAPGALAPRLIQMESRYGGSIGEARKYIEGRGAKFLNVLQPYLWSRTLTDAEQIVQVHVDSLYPDIAPILQAAYPHLQPYADVDLTHVLDEAREAQVLFFDGWHNNEVAGRVVARAIAAALRG